MEVTYAEASVAGPVRPHNEDYIGFWQPEEPELRKTLGLTAIIADGVGGQTRGEVASRMAVESALRAFQTAGAPATPARLLRQMFDEASRTVYDESLRSRSEGRLATTLTVSLFRNNEVLVGYAGDSRVYLVRRGIVRQLTTDHNYVGFQLKHGLITERHAMSSPLRSVLTRSLGNDPICRFDSCRQELFKGDFIVQCSDGLYGFIVDSEIGDVVSHYPPLEACRRLIALAERRQVDDNVSLQIIQINQVERIVSYRGATYYHESDEVPVSHELQPGQVLDNRFEILEAVNRSGMASIYRARDRTNGQLVAIKVPLMQFESDAACYSRFEREEQIGKTLNHPYILKIIPVDGEKTRPYIVMEFLEGQTLDQLMQKVRPLPEPDAVKIASRLCEALDYMHQHQVIHRDLKPQNIMLCNDGTLRVMDFGIAKSTQARRITFAGFSPMMGTPDYMAPEQVKGKRGDERTDIYSLGAILYEMATGSVPFDGENPYVIMNSRLTGDPVAPRKVNPKLTPVLEEILLHALERNPAERYPSASAMKAELDDYEKVEMTSRYKRLQPPQLWKSRFRMLHLIVGFVLLQVLVFIALFWFFSHQKGH